MKAIGYYVAHPLQRFALEALEVPEPGLGDRDVLVRIKAVSVNPVDFKIRAGRDGAKGRPVILGWDAAGVIERAGAGVRGFVVGDEVFYAGDLTRDGSNAELQAVDYRLIAKKPRALGFAEAAALPLTALTAWEALFEKMSLRNARGAKVLIIGGAGGVGSMAAQLLKAETDARVIATASRRESSDWCRKMGADVVLDHSLDLKEELKRHGLEAVDAVFSTTQSARYLGGMPDLIRPFGQFCLIDDPESLDIAGFKRKSISVHWELMFTKSLFDYQVQSQGEILSRVAALVEAGKLRSTAGTFLKGLTPETLRTAHEKVESGRSIGKVVIDLT